MKPEGALEPGRAVAPEGAAKPAGPGQAPGIEWAMARDACRPAIVLLPLLALIFGLLRGPASAGAAALGVALVVANLLASGGILSVVARRWPGLLTATALLSFVLRLGLLTATLLLLQRVAGMDRFAVTISAVAAYLVMVTWEVVAVARGSQREPEWSR